MLFEENELYSTCGVSDSVDWTGTENGNPFSHNYIFLKSQLWLCIEEGIKMSDFAEEMFLTNNIEPLEGYIGDEKKADILFILREPHGQKLEKFWFKADVVYGDMGKKYLNILGTLAQKLFNDETTDKKTLLKNCAYINLFPFCGGATASKKYKATRKA